jgi:hypothetical protein
MMARRKIEEHPRQRLCGNIVDSENPRPSGMIRPSFRERGRLVLHPVPGFYYFWPWLLPSSNHQGFFLRRRKTP